MDAYTAALNLLARRELSARQLRERLVRRKFDPVEVDAALQRLARDRIVDDSRVALASARLHAAVKGRGRRRVLQHVQQLGVSEETAKGAVDAVFGELDEAALLDRAIDKRLKGGSAAALTPLERARLVRRLVNQGFAPSQVFARLRARGLESDE